MQLSWKTTTFLAGVRTRGLVAPLIVDGAINGELFRGYPFVTSTEDTQGITKTRLLTLLLA